MKKIKMQPNTQFKINSVEELKQAYKHSEKKYKPINKVIADYNHYPHHNYWKTNSDNESYLGLDNGCLETIPNPFKSEYPKEMLVWNNCSKDETKILTVFGMFKGQYITTHAGHFIGYKNAKDIDQQTETPKDKILMRLESIEEKLNKIIENTN